MGLSAAKTKALAQKANVYCANDGSQGPDPTSIIIRGSIRTVLNVKVTG